MPRNPIDRILDENDDGPIMLYNENGEEVTFEQIALMPINGGAYTILKPISGLEGLKEDEALVFEITTMGGDMALELVTDDSLIDAAFAEYYKLLEEEGSN